MKRTNHLVISFIILFLLLFLTFGVVSADDPNIEDEEDNRFDYIDAVSGWFYEESDEPEYLFISMQLVDLTEHIGTVYAIHWEYDDVHYDVGLHNGVFIPRVNEKHWSCDYYDQHPVWFWREKPISTWEETTNSGVFDVREDIITWKIHKDCIGNPQPGEVLTRSYIFTAHRISKVGLIPVFFIPFSYELSDATEPSESQDYIVQY